MSAYLVDVETTGQPENPDVIELAIGKWDTPGKTMTPFFIGRFKPAQPMLFGALAMHHIFPEELEQEVLYSSMAKAALPTDMEYMIGHNVDYDWAALGRPACKRICTLAMARELWPGMDSHRLGALAYALTEKTHWGTLRDVLRGAHTADVDIGLTWSLLMAITEHDRVKELRTLEQLWQFSEEARIPKFWTFGKFEGKRIEEADRGYMFWCLRQADMDPYVHMAIKRCLGPAYPSSH